MLLDELKPCVCPLSVVSLLYLLADQGKALLLMKKVKADCRGMTNTTD